MKRILIIFLLAISAMDLSASGKGAKRFTFGTEWGYVGSFHCGIHHNFFSEEGYRVDLVENNLAFQGNGEVYLHTGYNLTQDWNLSLYAGLAGIYDFHRAIPISLRITRYFKTRASSDRWLAFADGGSGICLTSNIQGILTGKAGFGYSITLSQDTTIDLLLAYRMTLTHPEITYDGYEINHNRINRNNAYVSALSLSLALNF